MTENIDDPLNILNQEIDFNSESSSIDLVGSGTKEEDVVDLGNIDDLMKEDDDGDDIADLNEIDNLLSAAKDLAGKGPSDSTSDNFSEMEEPKPKDPKPKETKTELKIDSSKSTDKNNDSAEQTKFISNSPTSLSYKAEGKTWVEVTEGDSSEGSSIVKLEKPNENDVQSIDELSSSPAKSNDTPKSAEVSPTKPLEPAKDASDEPIQIKSPKEDDTDKSKPTIPTVSDTKEKKKEMSISEHISKFIAPTTDIIQLQNLHSSEKMKLEEEIRRIKAENEVLQTRLTSAERALKTREKSTSDLMKQIQKLTREKKAFEEQVRFWKKKANQVEKEVQDSVLQKQNKLEEALNMSNKKLALAKGTHKRKTTEMEIQMRRMEEKQGFLKEESELPSELLELQELVRNQKMELRMKGAEMKVFQEKLVEARSQIKYKEVAEQLQQDMMDMKNEVALVHESKKQIIRTLTQEIQELRSMILAYANRPSTEDLRVGIIKGYHFSRTTANKVYTKLFAPPPNQNQTQSTDF